MLASLRISYTVLELVVACEVVLKGPVDGCQV